MPSFGEPDPHLIEACTRVRVADCPAQLPPRFIEALEQNQLLDSCCRHPEDHLVGAYWSCVGERDGLNPANQVRAPDVYIFFCTCGRLHRRFMLGSGSRPGWEIR